MAQVEWGAVGIKGVRGRVGDAVFVKQRGGAESGGEYGVRAYVTPTNPRTPAQEAARERFGSATRAFRDLDAEDLALWDEYAARQARRDPNTGQSTNPTAIGQFVALTTRFLLVNAEGTIPTTPPEAEFSGDTITVTATAGTGEITFTASGPNAAGVSTEVLLQSLEGPNRKPSADGYRSAGVVVFTAQDPTAIVAVGAGYYAAAFRFIATATGQSVPLVPIAVSGGAVARKLKKAA